MDVNDKTKVSLALVGACLPFIVGGILWLASVTSDAKEAKAKVSELTKMVYEIRESIVRIETLLKNRGK